MKWGYVSYHFPHHYIHYCILCNEKATKKKSWAEATLLATKGMTIIHLVHRKYVFMSQVWVARFNFFPWIFENLFSQYKKIQFQCHISQLNLWIGPKYCDCNNICTCVDEVEWKAKVRLKSRNRGYWPKITIKQKPSHGGSVLVNDVQGGLDLSGGGLIEEGYAGACVLGPRNQAVREEGLVRANRQNRATGARFWRTICGGARIWVEGT